MELWFWPVAPIFLAASTLSCGCGGPSATTSALEDSGTPDGSADGGLQALPVQCSGAAPTLSKDVLPILHQNCSSNETCHGGFGVTPGAAWNALLNDPIIQCPSVNRRLVVPGDLDGSYVMHKLTGYQICPQTSLMPDGRKLPDPQIQVIADWICQGALND